MKNLIHRIAIIMLMLVIPLQAMAATSMLLCAGANTSVGAINPSSTTAMAMPIFILNSHYDEMAAKNVEGNEQTGSTKIKQMKHQCSQCATCVPMIGITSTTFHFAVPTITKQYCDAPFMTYLAPFSSVGMGGMFSILKVRKNQNHVDYKDPGWYQHPKGTQAYEWNDKLSEPPRQTAISHDIMPLQKPLPEKIEVQVRKPHGKMKH